MTIFWNGVKFVLKQQWIKNNAFCLYFYAVHMSNQKFTNDWSSTHRPLRVHMSDRRRIPSWITSQLLNYYRVHSQGISSRGPRNRENPAQNRMRRERKRARSNERKQTRIRRRSESTFARSLPRSMTFARGRDDPIRKSKMNIRFWGKPWKPSACESPSGNLSDRKSDFYFFTTARKDYITVYYCFIRCGDFGNKNHLGK